MFDDQGFHSFTLTHVECLADAETYLAGHPIDIVLLDLGLPIQEDWRESDGRAQPRPTFYCVVFQPGG